MLEGSRAIRAPTPRAALEPLMVEAAAAAIMAVREDSRI